FIKPHDQSLRAVDNQDESLFVDTHDIGSPATQQGGGHGVPPYQAYFEDADDSSGDSQPSANLDDWISSSDGDDRQDGWSSGDSQHAAHFDDLLPSSDGDDRQDGKLLRQGTTSSISQQPNKSSKRKQNFQIKALDGTEVYLGSRSPQLSETDELQSAPDRKDETHGQRPDTSDASQDLVSPHSSESPSATEPLEEESDRFMKIPAELRAKLRTIGDESTLAALMDYVNYTANPPPSAEYCADTLEDYQGPDTTSDQRFRVLKNRLVRDEAEEEITKYLRVSFRISKRFALAELSIRYAEAKKARSAMSRKRRGKEFPGLSPRDIFTSSLFPEIGNIEGEEERNAAREKAKSKFSSWITQGDPLEELAKQYGSLVLAILPENLTVADLRTLNRLKIQDVVDYINFVCLGLKEKVNNLSGVLLQRVDSSHPTQRQLLDILTFIASPKGREWQTSSAGIEDENSPNFAVDCNEYSLPSTPLGNSDEQSTSIASSSSASELHIKQPAVNIWQDGGMPDSAKMWNAHGQENRTVNPRDILQTPA
ncbi:hypothetical protein V501_00363, partial [Pseudogymnoascus sp. VKM F-4519 (FW-2642)]